MYPQATRRLSLFIFMALTILSALIVGYAVAKLLRGSTPTYTTTRATPEFEAEQFTRQTAVLGASEDDPLTTTAEVAATFFSPPPVTETATVAPTAVPTLVEALDRFVEDDFEDATTGWLERETTTSRAQYDGGRYRLMLNGQLGMSVSSTLPTENYRLRADVAAEQGDVDFLLLGNPDDLRQHGSRLVEPLATVNGSPDVPVACMQQLHSSKRSKGSPLSFATSLARVAQAGNGKWTCNGTGISGC